jgi:hypothetical protein
MQVIPSRRAARPRPPVPSLVGAGLLGTLLVGVGLAFGYLAFTTSIVGRLMETPRPGPADVALAVVVWTVALVAPAGLVIVGAVRLLRAVEMLGRSRRRTAAGLAADLSDDYVAATRVLLPDERLIPELIVGPHGVAIFEELPPLGASRHVGGRWEARLGDGRWLPIENPFDRASRDADRVRRWLATDDRDFVVKVYAAVIAPDLSLPRTPTCAVITRDQVSAFLASLPPQRSLTVSRRQRIVEQVHAAV